jgi:NitT/TauT family transport system substrate-binding protein
MDIPTYTGNFKLALQLMCTRRYKDNGIGYIEPKKMADTVNVVQKYMQGKTTIADPTSVYTPDLLTKADLPECGPPT